MKPECARTRDPRAEKKQNALASLSGRRERARINHETRPRRLVIIITGERACLLEKVRTRASPLLLSDEIIQILDRGEDTGDFLFGGDVGMWIAYIASPMSQGEVMALLAKEIHVRLPRKKMKYGYIGVLAI